MNVREIATLDLPRFKSWNLVLMHRFGRCEIRPNRPGVGRSKDLFPAEREEMFDHVIPFVEQVLFGAAGGGVSFTLHWEESPGRMTVLRYKHITVCPVLP